MVMPNVIADIHIHNVLGVVLLIFLWLVVCEGTHVGVRLLRREPMLAWAIGPLGVKVMFLHEPSFFYACLDVLCPALVSGCVLSIGLYTTVSPVTFSHNPLMPTLIVVGGVVVVFVVNLILVSGWMLVIPYGERRECYVQFRSYVVAGRVFILLLLVIVIY